MTSQAAATEERQTSAVRQAIESLLASPEQGPSRSTKSKSIALAAFIGVALVYLLHVAYYHAVIGDFMVDDAFIYFRYAHNLVEGHGLVYNPGERVEGYTGFTWVMLMAAAAWVGLPLVAFAQALGTMLGLATLWLVRCATRQLIGDGWVAVLPSLFLATNRTFCVWAIEGLETKLFGMLLVACFTLWIARERSPRASPWLGLLMAALTLTRPEGALFSGLILLFTFAKLLREKRFRPLVVDAAAFLSVTLAHLAFRRIYYGDWLPNTFYAKVIGVQAKFGIDYLSALAADNFFARYLVLTLVGMVVFAWPGRLAAQRRWALLAFAAYASYIVSIGGDFFEYRFFDCVSPLWALWSIAGTLVLARLVPSPRLGGMVLAACTTLWLSANLDNVIEPPETTNGSTSPEKEVRFTREFAIVGRWLSRNLPSNEVVAIRPAGAIAYLSGKQCLDILGLNDRAIARGDGSGAAMMDQPVGHQRSVTRAYLVERGVTYYIGHPVITAQPAPPGKGMVSVEIAPNRFLIMLRLASSAAFQDRVYLLSELAGSSDGWTPGRM